MSNTPGSSEAGADTGDNFSFDDMAHETLAEIGASEDGAGTNTDAAAQANAAAPTVDLNNRETPVAGADKAPATPDRWTAEEQAQFAALPPEAKALVEKRVAAIEADYQQKAEGSAEAVRLADEVRSVVDGDFQRKLDESGMTVGQGVKYLADLERFASTKPAEYLAFVAQHVQKMGVDVAKVLGIPQQPGNVPVDDVFADPRVNELGQRLDTIQSQLQQDAQRRALDNAGQQIASVRDAKDAAGNPLRPHFADVENDMAALVRANPKMTLEQAYDAAVWSNPAVRAKLQEADRKAAEEKARNDASTAQRAIRGNVRAGSTRQMDTSPPITSADDAAKAALAELNR